MYTHPTHTAVSDGRRAAASWVAGTGAFLLLAAAALFVAVNWDRIPPGGKLAIVVSLTGACVGAGFRLRPTLPATGGVLLHLGALLIPIDVAAVGIHLDYSLAQTLLAEGLVCSAAYLLLSAACPSVVLRWAADLAVITTAVGIDANTDIAAGVPLAAFAVLGLVAGRSRSATVWAVGAGVLVFNGAADPWECVLAGLVGAFVLGAQAEELEDQRYAFASLAVGGLGVVAAWANAGLSQDVNLIGAALAFVLVELVAMSLRTDPFWGPGVRGVAVGAEIAVALTAVPVAIGTLALALVEFQPSGTAAAASLAVLALGWLAADGRRGEALRHFTIPAAVCVAAAGVWSGWEFGLAAGSLGAAALLVAAARRDGGDLAPVFTVAALPYLLIGSWHAAPQMGANLVLAVLGLWVVANVVDDRSAALPRLATLLPLAAVPVYFDGVESIGLALLVVVLGAFDAIRRLQPHLALTAAAAVQVVVAELAAEAGLGLPGIGVALTVSALVWAGMAAVVEDDWRLPFVAAAAGAVALGLAFAAQDEQAFSDALVIVGALVLSIGVVRREAVMGHVGGLTMTVGILGHLAAVGVTVPEAYMLPVCVHLLAAGHLARRTDSTVSSWMAYAPATALMGFVALVQRIDGGDPGHGLVAGGVGVVAVAVGGWHRLAGPLFTGTALLVALVLNESLATLAGAPTWAWLAAGGTLLLSVGVALERTDQSPVEVGRRLVDVMQERFS